MTLRNRLIRLQQRIPAPRTVGIPTDPGAILAGLLAGRFTVTDMDPADADQVSALGQLAAMLVIRAAEGDSHTDSGKGLSRGNAITPAQSGAKA